MDRVRRRAINALFTAAQLSIQATANREIIAETDTLPVVVTLANHGSMPGDVDRSRHLGRHHAHARPCHSAPRQHRARVDHDLAACRAAANGRIDARVNSLFPSVRSSIDGLTRSGGMMLAPFIVPGVAVPEELRRTTDVTVSLTIAGVGITTSIGPDWLTVPPTHCSVCKRLRSAARRLSHSRSSAVSNGFQLGRPITRQLRLSNQIIFRSRVRPLRSRSSHRPRLP